MGDGGVTGGEAAAAGVESTASGRTNEGAGRLLKGRFFGLWARRFPDLTGAVLIVACGRSAWEEVETGGGLDFTTVARDPT